MALDLVTSQAQEGLHRQTNDVKLTKLYVLPSFVKSYSSTREARTGPSLREAQFMWHLCEVKLGYNSPGRDLRACPYLRLGK